MKKITTKDICTVGLLAAMVFVCTMFLGIKIPTPAGTTMLKTANAICIIGALLFGKWRGGLAAGLGSAISDFTYPEYAPTAWLTFIRFFLMAFLCGLIARGGESKRRNVIAAVAGSLFNFLWYAVESVVKKIVLGSAFAPAVAATVPKLITSGVNAVFAVVIAVLFAPPLRKALQKANIL